MISFIVVTLAILFIGAIGAALVFAKVAAKIFRKAGRHGYGHNRHYFPSRKAGMLMSLFGMALDGRRRHGYGHHRHHYRRHRHHGGDWDHDYDDYDDD
ncbi:MAG TPA: hypothetical protein VGE07_00400 [Herpetosiphonaceae bacterium]